MSKQIEKILAENDMLYRMLLWQGYNYTTAFDIREQFINFTFKDNNLADFK